MLYSVFRQMVRLPAYTSENVSEMTPLTRLQKRRARYVRASVAGFTLALSLIAAGCAPSSTTVVEEPKNTTSPSAVETPKATTSPDEGADSTKKEPVTAQPDVQGDIKQPETGSGEMVTVSVYTIDDQCNDFVEQSVQVPSDQAMNEAIGKAMGAVDYNAFKLDGYQVNISGSTAIVDMKLAPGSERQFVSLSSCEQRALFGSVEKTLLDNADWNVDAVKFTDSGKELIL